MDDSKPKQEDETEAPKILLELSCQELAEEILEIATENMAPPIDLDIRDAKFIAGWLISRFRKRLH